MHLVCDGRLFLFEGVQVFSFLGKPAPRRGRRSSRVGAFVSLVDAADAGSADDVDADAGRVGYRGGAVAGFDSVFDCGVADIVAVIVVGAGSGAGADMNECAVLNYSGALRNVVANSLVDQIPFAIAAAAAAAVARQETAAAAAVVVVVIVVVLIRHRETFAWNGAAEDAAFAVAVIYAAADAASAAATFTDAASTSR